VVGGAFAYILRNFAWRMDEEDFIRILTRQVVCGNLPE